MEALFVNFEIDESPLIIDFGITFYLIECPLTGKQALCDL